MFGIVNGLMTIYTSNLPSGIINLTLQSPSQWNLK